MKKLFSYFGSFFAWCVILLVLGSVCLFIANWVDVFQWIGLGFYAILTLMAVPAIIYVWIIRPIIELFKDGD